MFKAVLVINSAFRTFSMQYFYHLAIIICTILNVCEPHSPLLWERENNCWLQLCWPPFCRLSCYPFIKCWVISAILSLSAHVNYFMDAILQLALYNHNDQISMFSQCTAHIIASWLNSHRRFTFCPKADDVQVQPQNKCRSVILYTKCEVLELHVSQIQTATV